MCLGGHSAGEVINLNTNETVWECDSRIDPFDFERVHCSNDARCIAEIIRHRLNPGYSYEVKIHIDRELIFAETYRQHYNKHISVSPYGQFLVTQKDATSLPVIIRQIRGEGL